MPVNCKPPMSLTTLCPGIEATRSVSFRTLQQQYGDGYMARRQDGLNPLDIRWNLSTPTMSVEDCKALEAELIANGPSFFTWTEPFETIPTTWILDPVAWEWSYDTQDLARLSFSIRRWYS